MHVKSAQKYRQDGRRQTAAAALSATGIALLFIAAFYLFHRYQPAIEEMIEAESFAGMIAYVLIFALSIIFVPVSAMPLIPIGAKLWGIVPATLLSATGWTAGAMVAFGLARKFGKPYVARMIPLQRMEKVERRIPEEHTFWTIFFLRAVTPFDGLSYILGLISRVNVYTFFWSTFLGLIPFCLVVSLLGSLPTVFLIVGLILAIAFFIIGILRNKHASHTV